MHIVRKRLVAWFVSFCLILSMVPFSSLAAENPIFMDVQEKDWFYEDVMYVYDNSIMVGTSDTTFEPSVGLTRAMLVTILHRLEGEPSAENCSFKDVPAETWYENAVAWANENGIVCGYGNGYFRPERQITREESIIILYRYAIYKSMDVSAQDAFEQFLDGHETSQWAREAMRWATGLRLIIGRGGNRLDPTDEITRAETAALLHRFMLRLNHGAAEVRYTVRFEAKEEDVTDLPPAQKVTAGECLLFPTPPTRPDYSFAAWVTDAGEVFTEGDRVFSDLTLYAQWTQETGSGSYIFVNDESHLQVDMENLVYFYDNIINVFTTRSLSAEEAQEMAATVSGVVVSHLSGAVPFLQILIDATDYDTICAKVSLLEQNPVVLYTSYDVPWEDQNTSMWGGESDPGNEDAPAGKDWWAEAIGAYSAWEYSDSASSVRVGVIDSGFDWSHSELQGKLHNMSEYGGSEVFSSNTPSAHGTAVSGLIAARNDGEGIRGVADNAELICADWSPYSNNKKNSRYINLLNTGHYIEIIDQMIRVCRVKVINNSWGSAPASEQVYKNPPDDASALLLRCRENGASYEAYLQCYRNCCSDRILLCTVLLYDLVNGENDDFIIVQAAGNGYDNGREGYDTEVYGSDFYGLSEESFAQLKEKGCRNFSEEITYETLKDHLLIVGATTNQYRRYDYDSSSYMVYDSTYYSNYGDLIDVFAPGGSDHSDENGIYTTTLPGWSNLFASYAGNSGTSMAAPIVTGAVAFVWGLNPQLSAAQVKRIITGNQTTWAAGVVGEDAGRKYPMLNVNDAVEKAMETRGGLVCGKVCAAADRVTPVENATVTLFCGTEQQTQTHTSADGSYEMYVSAGSYRVQISAPGYIPFEAFLEVASEEVSYTETYLMVQGEEQSVGSACGRIFHAVLGTGLPDVGIEVRSGWNNTSVGSVITSTVTDAQGFYRLSLPLGNYTLLLTKDGFVTNHINIVVLEGGADEQNGTLSPISADGEFRIVLSWDINPRDLDSHVYGSTELGDIHTYYHHKQSYIRGELICALDVDDTSSYGPETITLQADEEGIFYYFVHHYAGSGSIASSLARVCVYQGEHLVAEFHAPTNQGDGEYWNVFVIVNGLLYSRNTITDTADLDFYSTED